MNLKDTIRLRTEQINFTFRGHVDGGESKEVMRITREGIWIDPDMNVEEAAQFVLDALNDKIKLMVKLAVEDEREQCAKVCMDIANAPSNVVLGVAVDCALQIRARGMK